MRKVPSKATLANMVFRVLLCNWLIAALASGVPPPPRPEQPLRIVVLGDSLVAGFGLKPSDAFPAQLERALKARGHAVEVINAGVSGDTTAGGLARVAWAVPEQTDAVILELGANDALRGLDPDAGQGQPGQDHHRAQGRAAPRCCSPACSRRAASGKDYVRAFDGIYPDLARQARADPLSVLPRRRGTGRQAQSRRRPAPQSSRRRRDHQEDPPLRGAADRAGARQAGDRPERLEMANGVT